MDDEDTSDQRETPTIPVPPVPKACPTLSFRGYPMAHGNPRIRVDKRTYEAISELASRWNVSPQKVIAIAIDHALSCNRIGTVANYPAQGQTTSIQSLKDALWWQMCADTLWVCAAIIDALHRLADIYPDLKSDWLHTPYEASRRFEVVARDWGLMPATEEGTARIEEEAGNEGEGSDEG